MTTTTAPSDYTTPQWAVTELMGHRRLAGLVTDVELFGVRMLQLAVPHAEGDGFDVQHYSPSALYCLTPCTEERARDIAHPKPYRWDAPELGPGLEDDDADDGDLDDDELLDAPDYPCPDDPDGQHSITCGCPF